MLNSADCRMKTARAPAGAPTCEKSSRSKGLIQGRRARGRQPSETSRYEFQARTPALSQASEFKGRWTATNFESPLIAPTHAIDVQRVAICHGQGALNS